MSKKIFIIEDDANTIASLQAKFSIAGFQIATNSGNMNKQAIINEVKKFKPDYMVLDLILPRVDGFEVLKLLRTDEDTSKSLIFVFTSLSDNDSKSRSLDLGVKSYFAKSDFSVDDFVAKVIKIINNTKKKHD